MKQIREKKNFPVKRNLFSNFEEKMFFLFLNFFQCGSRIRSCSPDTENRVRVRKTVFRIRIRWIPKILACWIRIQIRKICGSTDPDPRGKISTKICKKSFLLPNTKSELLKREIIKVSSFLNGSSSFSTK